MRVVARIRPLSDQEVGRGCTEAVVPILLDDDDNDDNCRDGNGNGNDGGMDMGTDENAPPSVFHTPKIGNRRTTTMMASDGDSSPMAQPQQKPASTSLLAGGSASANANANTTNTSAAAAMPKQFDYDAVFSSTTSQRDVYDQSVGDAIRRNVFRGYNTTIIAYGQTSSGKTYTMNGPEPPTEAEQMIAEDEAMTSPTARPFVSPRARGIGMSPKRGGGAGGRRQSSLARMAAASASSATTTLALTESDGIIPRAIHDLFETQRTEQREARIHLSYLEIYNDQIRDLLGSDSGSNDEGGAEGGTATAENLPLLDDGQGVSVRGLSSTEVRTAGEARELMDRASLRRTTGVSLGTNMGWELLRYKAWTKVLLLYLSLNTHHRPYPSSLILRPPVPMPGPVAVMPSASSP